MVGIKNRRSVILLIVIIGFVLITLAIIGVGFRSIPKDVQSKYNGTHLSISTEYDYLEYRPDYVSTRLGDWYAEFSFESTEKFLAFDNYDNYTYMAYANDDNTLNTAILVSESLPEQLNLSQSDIFEIEKTKDGTYAVENETDGVVNRSAYKKIYDIGYLIVIQQKESTSNEEFFADKMVQSISESMTFAKVADSNKSLTLSISGFGTELDLDKLSFIGGAAGVYFGQDNVLRIYNFKEDKTYGFIAEADNQYLMNYTSNMEPVDGINNLYYSKDYTDENKMGHRLFGVQTPIGYYAFKASNDAPETFEEEILKLVDFDSISSEFISGSVADLIMKNESE